MQLKPSPGSRRSGRSTGSPMSTRGRNDFRKTLRRYDLGQPLVYPCRRSILQAPARET